MGDVTPEAKPHPPGRPRYPFTPHSRGEPYWLTDGYGYGTEVLAVRWWWRRLVEAVRHG